MLYCGSISKTLCSKSISKTLYSKSISKVLYNDHVIYCSIRFIGIEVLYLPRIQSYSEVLVDEYTLLKDSTIQKEMSKEI